MNSRASAPEIVVVEDSAALAQRAAEIIAGAALAATRERGRFTIALAGGSTPEQTYRALAVADGKGQESAIPWGAWHVFFGDERFVPHDDPQSNYRMAREALLSRVPIPPVQIHPIPTTPDQPNEAAAKYENTLRTTFAIGPIGWPQFDVVLLGLGPDGHTASLFPGTPVVRQMDGLVAASWVEKFSTYRITLTVPVLCHAREVLFLVSGPGKAEVLPEVLEGPYDPDLLPAQTIRPVHGKLTWLVDRAAAVNLSRR